MEFTIPEKQYTCVDYPGIVQHPDIMLQSLGGTSKVAQTFCDPSKRLELCFRQKDAGGRPLFANRHICKGLLLRVRRHRHRVNSVNVHETVDSVAGIQSESDNSETRLSSPSMYQYSAEIMGIVNTVYKFQSLSDFQFLAANREPTGEYRAMLDQVYVTDLHNRTWLDEPTPLFLLPPMFSRLDHSAAYCYREPPQPRAGYEKNLPQLDPSVIGVSRKRRPHHTRIVSFHDKELPTEPHASAVNAMYKKRVSPATIDRIKKVFEEKPVWSRGALAAQLSVPESVSAAVLPSVAYYFISGPWRTMWVRFGYDPRTDPKAKIYQMLDVRVPRSGMSDEGKRRVLLYRARDTVAKIRTQPAVIQQSIFDQSVQSDRKELPEATAASQDTRYRFQPGIVPAYRQMFYQLCYVDDPDVQRLVHENDGCETECLERDGWCMPETIDKCRVLVTSHIGSSAHQADTKTDAASGKTECASELPADADSSGGDSDVDNDGFGSDDDEQQIDANDDDDDDDDDASDTAADSEQLETDVMKQLGLLS